MRGVPAVPDGSLALRVDQVFDASGELARVLDGYEPRASQRTLAVARFEARQRAGERTVVGERAGYRVDETGLRYSGNL